MVNLDMMSLFLLGSSKLWTTLVYMRASSELDFLRYLGARMLLLFLTQESLEVILERNQGLTLQIIDPKMEITFQKKVLIVQIWGVTTF